MYMSETLKWYFYGILVLNLKVTDQVLYPYGLSIQFNHKMVFHIHVPVNRLDILDLILNKRLKLRTVLRMQFTSKV